jgi:hypothetical protein
MVEAPGADPRKSLRKPPISQSGAELVQTPHHHDERQHRIKTLAAGAVEADRARLAEQFTRWLTDQQPAAAET